MRTRDQKKSDDASHNEMAPDEQKLQTERDKTQQGVVKDERGQEQPTDKKRATENR